MSRDYHCPITTTVTSCPRITYRFGNRQFENKKWELSASYRQPGVTLSASFLFNNSRLRIPPLVEHFPTLLVKFNEQADRYAQIGQGIFQKKQNTLWVIEHRGRGYELVCSFVDLSFRVLMPLKPRRVRGLVIIKSTGARAALADGITRRALFNVWIEEQDPKREIDAVLSLVRSTVDFDKYENHQQ
ncbi:hypothetical protein TNCV_657031 [Trichonephila clavipes]|nr:hypothetical protein TNCV_657031 [Trichonephila clavipes]